MKLWFIRHGDPDYAHDTLTEKGFREAAALTAYLKDKKIDAFYCSPLGRAKDTIRAALEQRGTEAEICPFLREFNEAMNDPETGEKRLAWDLLPAQWAVDDQLFLADGWERSPLYAPTPNVKEGVERTGALLDEILARHGYEREGRLYRAVRPNKDTIAIVCHFGITCVMLSHLLDLSPILLMHELFFPPTSLTILETEEKEEGIVRFRLRLMGGTPHLTLAGEPVSASGMFKEVYTDPVERRDIF